MTNDKKTYKEDILVFYHAKCTDGFGGAYSAYKKFGDKAAYIALDYAMDEQDKTTALHKADVRGKDVFMIDISASRETIEDVQREAKSFQLLDHHKSAYEKIGTCEHCFFDMSRSGAMIGWNYFHDYPAPKFLEYIQDGDLWTHKFEETKYFSAVVHNMPHDFKLWETMENPFILADIIEKGKTLREQFDNFVNGMVSIAKPVKFMGEDIYMSNCPSEFTSETGNLLALKTGKFAICWVEKTDHVKVSLRSVNGYDCSKIAEHFNGGGHPQACAFKVASLEDFIHLIKDNELTPIPEVIHKPKPFKLKIK